MNKTGRASEIGIKRVGFNGNLLSRNNFGRPRSASLILRSVYRQKDFAVLDLHNGRSVCATKLELRGD